jgi:arylsulfatase A
LPYSNDMIPPWVQTDQPLHLFRDTEPVEQHPVNQDTLTERYVAEATGFIKSSGEQPFFLYLPHSMPHLPVRTSDRFRGTSRAGLYGDVIETIDWGMGEILRTLKQERLDRKTMVIFTSDNGPWLDLPARMLQEGNERWHAGSAGLLRGYKGNTYEGGMRVPCIARWPGRIRAGQVSADIASTLDLFTTVVEAAGGTVPQDREIDGQNVLPFLQGETPSPVTEFFYCRSNNLEAVRDRNWKLRLSRHARDDLEQGQPLTPELFDLDVDPSEQYNVADQHPDVTDRLDKRLRAFGDELGAKVAPRASP